MDKGAQILYTADNINYKCLSSLKLSFPHSDVYASEKEHPAGHIYFLQD